MNVEFLPAASRAILDQADYFELQASDTLALRWRIAVNEAVRSLFKFPLVGSPCRFSAPALIGLRRIPIPHFQKYLLFYRYSEATSTLEIVHITHGARDLETLLAAPTP